MTRCSLQRGAQGNAASLEQRLASTRIFQEVRVADFAWVEGKQARGGALLAIVLCPSWR